MNREDIIEMAQSVLLLGFRDNPNDEGIAQFIGTLSDFAELVAEHEREMCAKVCDEIAYGRWPTAPILHGANSCAAAIRARGQA